MKLFRLVSLLSLALLTGQTASAAAADLYEGWLDMYDLRFDDAHRVFAAWAQEHPEDPLGPASDAAGYLFSELARLGALESELLVNDMEFVNRKKLRPDEGVKASFTKSLERADQLADAALNKKGDDVNALFVKALLCGLRADYAGLVEKENLRALSYTRQGRPYADKLLAVKPDAYDAYLSLGAENYLLSLKPAAVRLFLRVTGAHVDREKGLEQLKLASEHGRYFEPFAKLFLAVAALREKNEEEARRLLTILHERFPNNPLYARELSRLRQGTH